MRISNLMNATLNMQWSNFTHFLDTSVAPWSGIILATSATALLGLGVYSWQRTQNLAQASQIRTLNDAVRAKISRAYGYVFGGFTLTTLAAIAGHISGFSYKLLQNHYLAIPIAVGSAVALAGTLTISKKNHKAQHVAWAVFNMTMGLGLSTLGYLNQAIITQAAVVSLALGGALTLVAYLAPDKRFLAYEGPLMAALASLSLTSAIALFFPQTAFAYGVDRASLYGGLIIFSGFLMVSTQRLMQKAETQNHAVFDPLTSSMGIYLDGISIFLRVLRTMIENKKDDNA